MSRGEPESAKTFRLHVLTMLKRRCPGCGQGSVFQSLWIMHEDCPVCGLDFDRGEPGYFTGAMYVSYALGIPIISVLMLVAYLFNPSWSLVRLFTLAVILYLPLFPWVWQYSRVIWIHFDRWIDPHGKSKASLPPDSPP